MCAMTVFLSFLLSASGSVHTHEKGCLTRRMTLSLQKLIIVSAAYADLPQP